MINLIGVNNNRNDYNHASYQSGLNAWIGKLADGTVASVQTMPWNYRPWGCGSGSKGSCNNGWIQFEICEDNLNDINYFNKVYKEACELTAYLCKIYNLNPKGYAKCGSVNTPVILCHADSCKLGLGSNHGDVLHWFNKYGKTMNDVRNDVAALMEETVELPKVPTVNVPVEEEEEMTQEKFNEMMNTWIAEQANKEPSDWSVEARDWAEKAGLIIGDTDGKKMYKKNLTREEFIMVLYRALHRHFI
jgi:N-acetylmuramoyl-L-alanine amidase CwlA